MRSSKSRSRSKSNRSRSVGNIVNRVFDSSGPEGKVRGTPQQIIEKYLTLTRDAQLANDRVAAENFQQHAEHYARMLGEAQREAQREAEARREREEAQRREREEARAEREASAAAEAPQPEPVAEATPQPEMAPQPEIAPQPELETPQPDVVDLGAESDSNLVETPESAEAPAPKPAPKRRPRKKPAPEENSQQAAE